MPGEPVGAEETQLLAGVPDEEHRALRAVGACTSASAISSTPTAPLPSSSAPLKIESGLGGRTFRRLSRIARIRRLLRRWCAGGAVGPAGRITS